MNHPLIALILSVAFVMPVLADEEKTAIAETTSATEPATEVAGDVEGVAAESDTLVLFSMEEAEQLNYASVDAVVPPAEGDSLMDALESSIDEQSTNSAASVNGPVITFITPLPSSGSGGPIIQTGSPAALVINFEGKESEVDMSTLKIQAMKGMFSKSLTPLIKPYVKGSKLEADKIDVPTGNFRIEITITDKNGNTTSNVYGLVVADKK